jgi:hypothetical protein
LKKGKNPVHSVQSNGCYFKHLIQAGESIRKVGRNLILAKSLTWIDKDLLLTKNMHHETNSFLFRPGFVVGSSSQLCATRYAIPGYIGH